MDVDERRRRRRGRGQDIMGYYISRDMRGATGKRYKYRNIKKYTKARQKYGSLGGWRRKYYGY